MTPEEFRKYGHAVIDWIADYRARVEQRPVMSQAEPGQVKASLPPHPPEEAESFDAILRDLDSVVMPGISHWQHPRFFGYFPSNGIARQRPGRLRQHRTRRDRSGLAVEPGAERARGGGHGLAAPDGRPVARLGRRDSGHRLDQHAAGAVVRARAAHQLRSRAGRSPGGAQAAGRLHLGAGAQLGGEGGAARRVRPRERPHGRLRRDATGCAATRWPRRSPRTRRPDACRARWWRPPAPPRPRRSIRWPRSRGWCPAPASGCTSTRRWPARRWCCPNAAGCGRASRLPIRWC